MTPQAQPTDPDRAAEALDQAAAAAVHAVAVSYLAEVAGRPLTRRQRDLQARAERLARLWTRQQQGRSPR
jgi:hypothetical protein